MPVSDAGSGFSSPASDFDARAYWPRPALEPAFRRLIQAELPLFQPIMQSIMRYLGCDPHLFDAPATPGS